MKTHYCSLIHPLLMIQSPVSIEHQVQTLTLAKLLEKGGVTLISVCGDLQVPITGIKNDSRKVIAGDVFVSCFGYKTNGHLYINDAIRRGAVAVVISEGMEVDELLDCKTVVVVKNTNEITPVLAATFYNNPSKSLKVIGITGTNGKTTTAHLVQSLLNALAVKTGMLGSVGYYVDGENKNKLEAPNTTPDAVTVQELMAKMVKNGTEAMVMEVSSIGLAVGRCNEIDFDIAVFMNFTRDHHDFHGSEEEYKKSKAKLFEKMTDKRRHRKVINTDDPNADFFAAQGNPEVPVVSFAMEDKNADVHPVKIELNMFKTKVWVKTPNGVVEISSGLIGRYNVYNILASVAVGVAIGAPLKDIARGIENVEGVSGRFELIDEGQDFAVVVDYAHSLDSFSRLLDAGRELGAKRIITVFGCAGETDKGKRPMLVKIATEKSDVVVLTCGNPKTENQLHIFNDMLAGIGWNLRDFLQYSQNDQYLSHANGHRLFLHDIRRVAIRAAIAMGKKGDMIVIMEPMVSIYDEDEVLH
ncbi:hypothetical protein J5N97_023045 [Dioscorea zingiberensis]|uniref:Uncharacterized protein n=1 Tax=Dioscorea zingiberensis TaxID=325984 RepID=A0A9D5CBJ8_9LILI|nr:hypothetical protein J5N97_023045 [Dioscorea zingiberensis]